MQDRVIGSTMPVLEITLDAGETVLSESGEFGWVTDSIELGISTGGGQPAIPMDPNDPGATAAAVADATGTPPGASPAKSGLGGLTKAFGGKAGLTSALKRVVGGGTLLYNTYTAKGGPGVVSFPARLPGHVFPIEVGPGQEYLAHRHGFMAGTTGLELSVALQQKFSSGIYGGEGFLLQHIKGQGRAFIELSGEVLTFDLVANQSMRVHPGHVGLFESSVTFNVIRVPGITTRYFGGDGHHLVQLIGPGKIWLQSMPIPVLAAALDPYLDRGDRGGKAEAGITGGVIGGILGSR